MCSVSLIEDRGLRKGARSAVGRRQGGGREEVDWKSGSHCCRWRWIGRILKNDGPTHSCTEERLGWQTMRSSRFLGAGIWPSKIIGTKF